MGVYIRYGEEKRLGARTLEYIDMSNRIIAIYQEQGYQLTLRQLYYQLVARDLIENTQRSYKNLGNAVATGRKQGLIDWEAIIDRTRNVEKNSHWGSISSILEGCANQFRYDLWADQEYRPEIWIEKAALLGVIEDVCEELDVSYFACRGYTSLSEMWRAGRRFRAQRRRGQTPVIIHLGDHDPSGIDMTRDNFEQTSIFGQDIMDVRRIALNMNQVEEYDPPPNPAKLTDSRSGDYVAEHGYESWELDALEPQVISDLITNAVLELRDEEKWDAAVERQMEARARLQLLADEEAMAEEDDDEEDDDD